MTVSVQLHKMTTPGQPFKFPGFTEYQAKIQNPHVCFRSADLKTAQLVRMPIQTPQGLKTMPKVWSGQSAVVFRMDSPVKHWAVRCFLSQTSDQYRRYNLLNQYLASLPTQWSPRTYLVEFHYLDQEMLVSSKRYPIVKMEWVEGEKLHEFVNQNIADKTALLKLAEHWRGIIGWLHGFHMAHGDLQHGNVLVTKKQEIRLVDYDCMFVPLLSGDKSPEYGHANYQHPQRKLEDYYTEHIDNFSALVVYLSLLGLAAEPRLWAQVHQNYLEDKLILGESDYKNPEKSVILQKLKKNPDSRVVWLADSLERYCKVPISQVPDLETVLVGPRSGSGTGGPDPLSLKIEQLKKYIEVAIADGVLNAQEKNQILGLGRQLGIPQTEIEKAINAAVKKRPVPRQDAEFHFSTNGFNNFISVDVNSGIKKAVIAYTNRGSASLRGTVATDAPSFLRATPTSFSQNSGDIELTLDTAQLQWGKPYSPNVIINYNGKDSPKTIPVSIKVKDNPAIADEVRKLSHQALGASALVGACFCILLRLVDLNPMNFFTATGLDGIGSVIVLIGLVVGSIWVAKQKSDAGVGWGVFIGGIVGAIVLERFRALDLLIVPIVSTGIAAVAVLASRRHVTVYLRQNGVNDATRLSVRKKFLTPPAVFLGVLFIGTLVQKFDLLRPPARLPPPAPQLALGQVQLASAVRGFGQSVVKPNNALTAGERIYLYAETLNVNHQGKVQIDCGYKIYGPDGAIRLDGGVYTCLSYSRARDANQHVAPSFIVPVDWAAGKYRAELVIKDKISGLSASRYLEFEIPLPSVEVSAKPNTFTSQLNAKVMSIRFYESAFFEVPREQRIYGNRFTKASTRYINWELNYQFPQPGRRIAFEITVQYYRPDGSQLAQQSQHVSIEPHWSSAWTNSSWGWKIPGQWPVGAYKVVLSVDGQQIADGSFEVAESSQPIATVDPFVQPLTPGLWNAGQGYVQKMIMYASVEGGMSNEGEIQGARRQIESLQVANAKQLSRGNRIIAREANDKGLEHQKQGRLADAVKSFRLAHYTDPADVEVINNLGHAYMLSGDLTSAEKSLTIALLLSPARGAAWFNLGQVYAKQGQEREAVAAFANTYRFSQDRNRTGEFLRNLVENDQDASVKSAARKALDLKLMRRSGEIPLPAPPEPSGTGSIAKRIKVRLQDAGFVSVKVQQSGPQEITLSGEIGSRQVVEKVKAIANREAKGHLLVIRWDIGIAVVRKPQEPRADQISDHIKVAKFFHERGEYANAISELEKALSIDPTNREVQVALAKTRQACLAEKQIGRTGLRC